MLTLARFASDAFREGSFVPRHVTPLNNSYSPQTGKMGISVRGSGPWIACINQNWLRGYNAHLAFQRYAKSDHGQGTPSTIRTSR